MRNDGGGRSRLSRRRLLQLAAASTVPTAGAGLATGGLGTGGRETVDAPTFAVRQGDEVYTVRALGDGRDVVAHYDPPRTHDQESGGHLHSSTSDLPVSNASRLYFWDGPEGLGMVVLHDTTFDGDGGDVRFEFEGLPEGSWVAKDDPTTHNDNWGDSYVDWQWGGRNTDGGAFRGALADAEVTIQPQFQNGIDEWQLLSASSKGFGDPEVTTLDMDSPITIFGPERRAEEVPLDVYPYEIVTSQPLTVLSGMPWPPLELRYENLTDEVIPGIGIDATVESDGLSVTGTSPPDRLGPGAVEDDTVDVETGVAPDAVGEHDLDLTVSGEGIEDTRRRYTATVEPTLTADVEPAVPGRERLEGGQNEPVAFTIASNDVLLVDDVEAVFRTSELPGDWGLAPSGNVGTNTRGAGGTWEASGDDWVWTKDRMARGETQTPEITFAVPDGVASGDYSVPVELSARDGSEEEQRVVTETEATLRLGQTLVDAAVTAPDESLLPDEPVDLTVELRLLGDLVRDPQVRVEGLPGDIAVREATASDGGTGRTETGGAVWTWSGEHEPGQTYEATLTVAVERGADAAGGSVSFAGRATVESVASGETQTDDFTGNLAVSGLSTFTSGKRALAGRLDDISIGGIGEADAVEPILAEVVDAVEREQSGESGLTLTEEEAQKTVERLFLGEAPARYCYELMGPASPPRPNLTDGSIARRTASRALSVGFALATLGLGAGKIATAIVRGSSRLKRLGPVIRELVERITKYKDELISLGGRVEGLAKDAAEEVVEGVATNEIMEARGMLEFGSDALSAVTDEARDGIIEYVVQGALVEELDGLHGRVNASAAADGLSGSIGGARDAHSGGISTMESQYETADSVLNDLEDSWIVDIYQIGENQAEIWINLAEAAFNAITLDLESAGLEAFDAVKSLFFEIKAVFETVTKFFTGGSPATVMGGVSIRRITETSGRTIRGVADGSPQGGGS